MEILIKEIAVNPVTKNEDSAPGVSTLVWLQHNQNLLLIVREFVRGNTSPPHLISSIIYTHEYGLYSVYFKRWYDISAQIILPPWLMETFPFSLSFTRF